MCVIGGMLILTLLCQYWQTKFLRSAAVTNNQFASNNRFMNKINATSTMFSFSVFLFLLSSFFIIYFIEQTTNRSTNRRLVSAISNRHTNWSWMEIDRTKVGTKFCYFFFWIKLKMLLIVSNSECETYTIHDMTEEKNS